MRLKYIIFLVILFRVPAIAQSPDFVVPATLCLNQTVTLQNTSTGSASYLWDFCHDGFLNPTGKQLAFAGPAAETLEGIDAVNDNGTWFVFFFGRGSNNLYRLNFGSDINNPSPVITNLGNLNNLFDLPTRIRVVKEGSQWYGIAANFSSSHITRISFGTSLNTPVAGIVASDLGSTAAANPRGLDVVASDQGYVVLVSSWSTNSNLELLRFSNGLGNNPSDTRVVSTTISRSLGTSIINDGNGWYALVCGFGDNSIHHVNLGGDLFDTGFNPVVNVVGSSSQSRDVKLIADGKKHFALIEYSSGLSRIDFGASMAYNSSDEIVNIGNFNGAIADPFGIGVVRNGASWNAFTIGQTSGEIYKVNFEDVCSSGGLKYNTVITESPTDIFFTQAGDYQIDLIAYNASGGFAVKTSSVTASNLNAVPLSITNDNSCVGQTNHFSAQAANGLPLTNTTWDFGGGNTATGNSASIQFPVAGNYLVKISSTASNGCGNEYSETISIVNPPVPNFDLPTGVLCTNQEYVFSNTSTSDAGSIPQWSWNVDGAPATTNKDLTLAFVNTTAKSIQLTASIPGCSASVTQNFGVQFQGPVTNFLIDGKCQLDNIQFTNQTVGEVATHSWDLGDGTITESINPQHVYNNVGTYTVKLLTTNAAGCNNSTTKQLTIYSKPQPDFSIELPPFSCSGTPSQFTNTTPNLTDSNFSSWAWQFGDEGNGTSGVKDALYTFSKAGDYSVNLTATTNNNCSASITKVVKINESPAISFTNTPTCLNLGTRFADGSGSDIKSWLWTIGNSTYSFSNPTHVFSATGDYSVKLTVTGNNDCVATLTKTITVPVSPVLDFSFSSTCEGQTTVFQNTSSSAVDPVASLAWDFAGNTGSGSPAQYLFASPGTYAVKMTSTQQSGCIYSISKNVIISPSPVAKFSASPEWGTAPLSVQFTNQSTGASTYLWRFNDKNSSTSTDISPAFKFTDLGDYVVDLIATSAQGCTNSVSTKISVIVPSLDVELTNLNLIKDPTSGSYRIMVTIKNKSNFVLTSADVIVDISGNARIKETIATTIVPNGEVSQLLTNQIVPGSLFTYLCAELDLPSDIDLFNNKICESVSDEGVIFSPYPNPSNGEFRFDWISQEAGEAHFAILNATGQIVFQQDVVVNGSGFNQAQFDLTSYQTGTYFFKFNSGPLSKTVPIVILR